MDSNLYPLLAADVKALKRFDEPTFDRDAYELKQLTTLFNTWQVLGELGLAQEGELAGLLATDKVEDFVQRAVDLLGGDIALETDWMYQNYFENDSGTLEVIPQQLGLNRFNEEFLEALNSPGENFYEDEQLLVFFALLNGYYGEEAWQNCSEAFGWGIPAQPDFPGDYLDEERFQQLLTGLGYQDFYTVYEINTGGNPYFYYTWDESPAELTADLILALREDYKDAQAALKILAKCTRRVKRRKKILKDIAATWCACAVKKPDERVRVRV